MLLMITILQIGTLGIPFVQLINYVIMLFNFVVGIIITVVVIPTYLEHKQHKEQHIKNVSNNIKIEEVYKDYSNRTSPQALELSKIERQKMDKLEKDISDIKHQLSNLINPIKLALERKDNEPDWNEIVILLKELKDR